MPFSTTELLNMLDLEQRLATQIRDANTTVPREANAQAWIAEQVSLYRIDALNILLGGVAPDPNAPLLRIAFAGSSTYQKYTTDGGGTPVSGAEQSTDGVSFSTLGTTGAGLLAYAGIMARRTGRPTKYLMTAQGGTTTTRDWLPAGSSQRASLVSGIKAMGGCDLVNWACDFNDLLQGLIVDQATTLANIREFYRLVRAETGLPNLKFTQGVIQSYTAGGSAQPDALWTAVRAAEMIAAKDPNVIFGTHWFDLPQGGDGIHLAESAYPLHAARLAENSLAILGLANAVPEYGPSIVAAEAVYTTQTRITLAHSTGDDITPANGLTGFLVSFDGGQTMVPATGRRVDATTVILTHAASGGAAPLVYAFTGRAPNTTVVLRDNSPRSLPLNPTIAPIAAPAGTTTPAPAPPGTRTILVAFSKSLVPPSPYNAFHDSGSQAQGSNIGLSIPLIDTTGKDTGWRLVSVNGFSAGNDAQGQTGGGGRYPEAVTMGYIYTGNAINGDNGNQPTPSSTFVLRGPASDRNMTLELDLFGSRSAPDRKTTFGAGGMSQTVDSGQNLTNIATFTNLQPDNQVEVPFTFAPATNYQYGYLNVAEIRIIG